MSLRKMAGLLYCGQLVMAMKVLYVYLSNKEPVLLTWAKTNTQKNKLKQATSLIHL